jgi:beta-glucosidase
MGQVTAQEALAVGVNWLLAPVVDVNNNPDNPAINIRAFGDRPEVVADLTTAFIQGAKSTAILTTAKHFPGHGDTSTDSHLDLPALNHSESRLAEIELPPFEQAIAAGVDSVMTAHLLISAWDSEFPATLSQKIVTEILRNRLGFSGLVVTDALIMGGITKYAPPEAVAVMAIEAGTDILLMPDNPEVAIASIYDAVQTGQIKESRIQESLERIWQAKHQVCANLIESIDVTKELSSDRARATVNSILQNSLQQSTTSIIVDLPSSGRNLIVVDDVLNTTYLDINSPAITIPQQYNYQRQLVDSNTLDCILLDSRPTLLQVFIRGNPFRGNAGLTDQTKAIYQKLLTSQQVLGMAIYGSPYVLEWFQSMINSDLPWVFTYGQMEQAQAIALPALFTDKAQTLEFEPHDFGF